MARSSRTGAFPKVISGHSGDAICQAGAHLDHAQSSRRDEREALRNVEIMWLTGRERDGALGQMAAVIAQKISQLGAEKARGSVTMA